MMTTSDFSTFDAGQSSTMAMIEAAAVELACGEEAGSMWKTISCGGMCTQFGKEKKHIITGNYCRASGEKSTSWGNTLLTFLMLRFCEATHTFDVWNKILTLSPERAYEDLMIAWNEHLNTWDLDTYHKPNLLVEGDDSISTIAISSDHIEAVGERLGFTTKV